MNLPAVFHRPIQDFIYPHNRNELIIQLITAANDIDKVTLLYWERYESSLNNIKEEQILLTLRDQERDCYRIKIRIDGIAAYIRYCFRLESAEDTVWFGNEGFYRKPPQLDWNYFEFLWPNVSDGFNAPDWSENQIYYQIFPERFFNGNSKISPNNLMEWGSLPTRENYMGGDLDGILQKLDYIQDLGITCIYLTPIFHGTSNHKYDTVDYYKIDPGFGTEDDFRKLVDAVHEKGMRIILDGVFNHCGYYFPYFQDVIRNGEASSYKNWFYIKDFPVSINTCNYDCVGHYKWMPKINLSYPDARNYFIDVGIHWIKQFGIDGWRLDVADEIPTEFIERFSAAIRFVAPDALLIGETWGDAQRLIRGNRLNGAMNYLFRDAVTQWIALKAITAGNFNDMINRMLMLYPYEVSLRMYNMLDSHDTARFMYLCGNDLIKMKMAVALQMTFPGCPAIFYGDEIGISGDNDPLCRQCMEWDVQKQNISLKSWYKKFIELRKRYTVLSNGRFKSVLYDDSSDVLCYERFNDDEIITIILNTGYKATKLTVPGMRKNNPKIIFLACADDEQVGAKICNMAECQETGAQMIIPEYSVIIYKKEREGIAI